MCLAGCSDYPESCESCRSIKHSRHTRVLDLSVSNILWLNGLCLLAFQFEARVCLSWSLVLGGGFVWLLHPDSFCLSLCLFRVLENSRKICYRQHRVASFTLQRSQAYTLAHTELELSGHLSRTRVSGTAQCLSTSLPEFFCLPFCEPVSLSLAVSV